MTRKPTPTAETPDAAASAETGRREPSWGRVEALTFAQVSRGYRAVPAPQRRLAWGVAAALGALLVLAFVFRQPLADWAWPETRAQTLRAEAAQALANGHLTAADGSGARELYQAAIAIDPDRNEARIGLAQVAQAALAQARVAMRQDRFEQAHRMLVLAQELQVPRAEAERVAVQLREREAGVAGLDGLLAQAVVARTQGRLDGDDASALPIYRRVLSLQPRNIAALEGREDALSELLQQARSALQAGQLPEAVKHIAAARGYDPGHVDLPQTEADLTRALDQLRQQADRDLRRGRATQAAAAYGRLLEIDPEDAAALRGRAGVAELLAQRAERAAADFDFGAANRWLREARALAPGSVALAHAADRIEEARRSKARLNAPSRRGAPAQVARLLREAAAAQARGDLLTPPGESAYDKVRSAQALAPGDAAVRKALLRLVPAARQCYERQLPRNDLGRARACLDAWIALEGESTATRAARRRLAQRWLAVGDERLGAGELDAAARALEAAIRIDPAVPGKDAFRRRLRAASALTLD